MCCPKAPVKGLFYFINAILALPGLALIGCGIWMMVDKDISRHLEVIGIANSPDEPLIWQVARMFVAVGVATCIIGFLGCCAARKDSQRILFGYALLIIPVAMATLAGPIMLLVHKKINIEKKFDANMLEHVKFVYLAMDEGGDPDSSKFTRALDAFQNHVHCCGGENYTDFRYSKWWNATRRLHVGSESLQLVVPTTCCHLKNTSDIDNANSAALKECQQDARTEKTESDILYTKGCRPVLQDWYSRQSHICVILGFCAAAVQLLGVVLACCLRTAIKKDGKERSYVA